MSERSNTRELESFHGFSASSTKWSLDIVADITEGTITTHLELHTIVKAYIEVFVHLSVTILVIPVHLKAPFMASQNALDSDTEHKA